MSSMPDVSIISGIVMDVSELYTIVRHVFRRIAVIVSIAIFSAENDRCLVVTIIGLAATGVLMVGYRIGCVECIRFQSRYSIH